MFLVISNILADTFRPVDQSGPLEVRNSDGGSWCCWHQLSYTINTPLLPFAVSLWHKCALCNRFVLCCYDIVLGASIVRFDQSEQSISRYLDQWEWSTLPLTDQPHHDDQDQDQQQCQEVGARVPWHVATWLDILLLAVPKLMEVKMKFLIFANLSSCQLLTDRRKLVNVFLLCCTTSCHTELQVYNQHRHNTRTTSTSGTDKVGSGLICTNTSNDIQREKERNYHRSSLMSWMDLANK